MAEGLGAASSEEDEPVLGLVRGGRAPDADLSEADDMPAKRRVVGKKGVAPGVDSRGNDLPKDDAQPYSVEQAYVIKQLCAAEANTKMEFDKCKGRHEKRAFVNSLVPRDATYGLRIDPALAKGHIQRIVTEKRTSNEEEQWTAMTLTDLEVAWGGEKKVELGLARGDVRIRPDGMYEKKTGFRSQGKSQVDELKVEQQADCSGEQATTHQDSMLQDVIKDWDPKRQAPRQSAVSTISLKSKDSSGGGAHGGCSDKGWEKVSVAYDVVSKVLRETKAIAIQLRTVNAN